MFKFLKKNGTLIFSFIGLVAITFFVWFMGPFLPLVGDTLADGISTRVIIIAFIFMLWGIILLWQALKKAKKNDNLYDDLQQKDSHIDGEEQDIQNKFNQALNQIKDKQGKDKFNIYDKPWYVIIGPPGCGKTTALENSGLQFPLNSNKFEGISGTKNCDWWFTDKAVMIDTAGRFTTHDSQRKVDHAGWNKFLEMLKQHRQVRPINGVIVAFSIRDLIDNGPSLKLEYARTIRARIEELNKQLGIKFPVYFMFTKCDLIEGFSEFFAHFEPRDREQVWGETFGFKDFNHNGIDIEQYSDVYQNQLQRLQRQMLSRLNREANDKASSAIINFPIEMAALEDDISHFLYHAFAPNHMQQDVILRGVYFTCGTLESTSVDKLSDNLANEWGIETTQELKHRQGLSFFLRNLLNDVIFKESELAGIDQSYIRKGILRKVTTLLCCGLVTGLLSTLWYFSYNENSRLMNEVQSYIAVAKDKEVTGRLAYPDFEKVVKELNNVQLGHLVYDESTITSHAGLYQGEEIQQETERAYIAALNNKLLPVLIAQLQEMVISAVDENKVPLTYKRLKAYLMYAGEHIDADVEFEELLLSQISQEDWQDRYSAKEKLIEQLKYHHNNLLDYMDKGVISFNELENDGLKVANLARESLRKSPLANQVYQATLDAVNQAPNSSPLTFEQIAGNLAYDVFKRRTNQPLDELQIPFAYTKTAFFNFKSQYTTISSEYVSDNWVIGKHNTWQDIPNQTRLNEQVLNMYYRDYIAHWQRLIKDLEFIESNDIYKSMLAINQASAINGPIEMIIRTIASETNLTEVMPDQESRRGATDAIGEVSSKAQRVLSTADRVAKNINKATGGVKFAEPIIKEFYLYHRLVDEKRGSPPIKFIVEEIERFNSYLKSPIESGFADDAALQTVKNRIEGRGNDRYSALKRVSNGAPVELEQWINTMSRSGWSILLTKARTELDKIWQRDVYTYYQEAIASGYPISRNSTSEIQLRDFAEFFGPTGVIDRFIKGQLKPFISMNRTHWEEKVLDGQSLNIKKSTLSQLLNASRITRLFFPKNSSEPSIDFTVERNELSKSIFSFKFNFGEYIYEHRHDPIMPISMSWPLNIRNQRSAAMFTIGNKTISLSEHGGPWSMFRLLDDAKLIRTSTNSRFIVEFTHGDAAKASFVLRVNSEFNPIGAKMLQNFTLPREL